MSVSFQRTKFFLIYLTILTTSCKHRSVAKNLCEIYSPINEAKIASDTLLTTSLNNDVHLGNPREFSAVFTTHHIGFNEHAIISQTVKQDGFIMSILQSQRIPHVSAAIYCEAMNQKGNLT